MKRRTLSLIVSGVLALAHTFASAADTPLPLDIDGRGQLVPVDVTQTPTDGGLVVAGRVEKRWIYRGRILGHVDVDLLNQDGEVIAARQGALYGRSPTARNPDRARFSIEFASLSPNTRSIAVRHHVGLHCAKPAPVQG